jgi:hypothetical protein
MGRKISDASLKLWKLSVSSCGLWLDDRLFSDTSTTEVIIE